jgi:hypothetical protein
MHALVEYGKGAAFSRFFCSRLQMDSAALLE